MPVHKRLTIAVAAMAATAIVLAASLGSRSAAGADSYGYISQADAWLAGQTTHRQPFLDAEADRPPVGRWVLAPLGWKPAPGSWDLVPTYAAGYPLVLAAFKAVAGHRAIFWVVPLASGLLVWSTFLLGCRLGRPAIGALAAALVATSPTFLYMSMLPMSDVPSAALWTFALALVLGGTRVSALAAGAIAALAIVVRPNLVPLALLMGVWLFVQDYRARRVARGRAVLFAPAAACGAIATALINKSWYGSATASGYGNLDALFDASNIPVNAVNYSRWLMEAETPLALAGLVVALAAPWIINRRRDVVGVPALIWLVAAWVWGTYLYYQPFEVWWYLRFVLPAWPLMALGSACLIGWLWQRRVVAARAAASVVVASAIAAHWYFAREHSVFTIGFTESRYPQVARAVGSMTAPSSGILTLQHSGTARYYGGRMTLRWDSLQAGEFGPLVAWMRARGHHPYLLVDSAEVDELRARFPNDPALAPLALPPMAEFFLGETILFDLDATGPVEPTRLGAYTRRAIEPARPPHWDR